MTKPAHDLIFGVAVSAVALGYAYSASRIPTSLLSDAVGPGGFPIVLGIAVATLGLFVALQSAYALYSVRRAATAEGDTPPPIQAKGFALLLIGLGYIVVAPVLGYFPSLFLLVAAVAWLGGAKPGWRFAAAALCITAVLTVVFVTIMDTTQPAGLLHTYLPRMGF